MLRALRVPNMMSVLLLAASAAALSAPETVHQALRSRRTTHNFQRGQPVGEDILRRAVEAATMAPNHKLTEPWLFRRLGRQSIEAIATLNAAAIADPDKAKAKAARWAAIENWLVAASDDVLKSDAVALRRLVVTSRITPDDELLTLEDYAATCCAVQNLQLSFAADGVGTKWTSGDIQRTPEFEKIVGVDAQRERVVGVVWYGFADGDAKPAKRKLSVDDVLLEVA